MHKPAEQAILELYTSHFGQEPGQVIPLPPSGSDRQYYRLQRGDHRVIGAYNPDQRENEAFVTLSRHFFSAGLPVPELFAYDRGTQAYLVTDLGDTTLFSILPKDHDAKGFSGDLMDLYRKAIDYLVLFQVDGAEELDFSICYPRQAFDRQSMMWDLNYFKYYFLKVSGIGFDEQRLEEAFERFAGHLLQAPAGYFMYRDFQSRNIMLVNGKPYFIDYQGGRKGPLAYDIASLLFDAKANIPYHQREELLAHYMDVLEARMPLDRQAFRRSVYHFVLMRILQALGAYGFRGGVEGKTLFLESVPYALKNLDWLNENDLLPSEPAYLLGIVRRIIQEKPSLRQSPDKQRVLPPPDDSLTVRIGSFSYKKGVPADNSGNGGGFVFDCRALPNPGRQERYRNLSGKDDAVIQYLEQDKEVLAFLDASLKMVEPAVDNYSRRGFTSLAVCYGCTGGQHRSVYCAEQLARKLRKKPGVHVILQHFEEDNWAS